MVAGKEGCRFFQEVPLRRNFLQLLLEFPDALIGLDGFRDGSASDVNLPVLGDPSAHRAFSDAKFLCDSRVRTRLVEDLANYPFLELRGVWTCALCHLPILRSG